jgi:hypothetical protein
VNDNFLGGDLFSPLTLEEQEAADMQKDSFPLAFEDPLKPEHTGQPFVFLM